MFEGKVLSALKEQSPNTSDATQQLYLNHVKKIIQ